ncbi:DUF4134 family protein [Phocaeicola sp.]
MPIGTFTAGNGLKGISVTSVMSSYFAPATRLYYAIGACVGLSGGIKVYLKCSSGDPDASKAVSCFFACIFLIVTATILRSFCL